MDIKEGIDQYFPTYEDFFFLRHEIVEAINDSIEYQSNEHIGLLLKDGSAKTYMDKWLAFMRYLMRNANDDLILYRSLTFYGDTGWYDYDDDDNEACKIAHQELGKQNKGDVIESFLPPSHYKIQHWSHKKNVAYKFAHKTSKFFPKRGSVVWKAHVPKTMVLFSTRYFTKSDLLSLGFGFARNDFANDIYTMHNNNPIVLEDEVMIVHDRPISISVIDRR